MSFLDNAFVWHWRAHDNHYSLFLNFGRLFFNRLNSFTLRELSHSLSPSSLKEERDHLGEEQRETAYSHWTFTVLSSSQPMGPDLKEFGSIGCLIAKRGTPYSQCASWHFQCSHQLTLGLVHLGQIFSQCMQSSNMEQFKDDSSVFLYPAKLTVLSIWECLGSVI